MNKPILAITMGDPASIGPSISIKALKHKKVTDMCNPVIVGDSSMMEYTRMRMNETNLKINSISSISQAIFEDGIINVLDLNIAHPDLIELGKVQKLAGEAAFRYVEKAITLAMDNEVDATVTNALNKESLNLAGHNFSGHTEIYAHYTNTDKYTMMLAHDDLKVVHISTHVSLRDACNLVKKDRVLDVIKIADTACRDLGIESPTIGVAALNPHASEGGLFGTEEEEEIIPAINAAISQGIQAIGPIPADTIFSRANGGWYDIVVAMYHDQGHIPLKVLGFVYNKKLQKWDSVEGVNITLGIPIIRTSVDHGTAFGHVEEFSASELSLVNAIDYATKLAIKRIEKRKNK